MKNYVKTEIRGKGTDWEHLVYLNDAGKSHRLDGPAVEWADGDKFWYLNGKLHRLDGPAVELAGGYKGWWLWDEEYTEEEWKLRVLQMEILNKL